MYLEGGDGEVFLPIGVVDRREVDRQKEASVIGVSLC